MSAGVVHTAGHGTRTAEELSALLREAAVVLVADVRSFPGSRRNPQHARAEHGPAIEELQMVAVSGGIHPMKARVHQAPPSVSGAYNGSDVGLTDNP